MKSFQVYLAEDNHNHLEFGKQYACFAAYLGRQRQNGDASALEYVLEFPRLKREYDEYLRNVTVGMGRTSASTIVNDSIESYTSETITQIKNAEAITGEKHPNDGTDTNRAAKVARNELSSGRGLKLQDLIPPGYSLSDDKRLLDTNLPSSDPQDPDYYSELDLYESTTRVYDWNHLEGDGRHDSKVDIAWIQNNVEIGRDLMDFRDRVIQNNGGLEEPHEKLAVNFVFLVEGDHQIRGLHTEVEDETWAALCDATKDPVKPLPKSTLEEVHWWAHFLARESPESFRTHLRGSPPNDPTLHSVLNLMVSSGQLWSDQPCNEDTYLKARLGPFLETYLGNIAFTTGGWTQIQQDTRNADYDLLVPDYSTITLAGRRELSVVLLEGKVASNRTFQIWDDRTKLGQEMKLALDSILKLLPGEDVSVVGILVKGFCTPIVSNPLVEFFTMRICSEGTYILRRFAVSYIAADPLNMLPVATLMEAFGHAQSIVNKTVSAIRRVKVRPTTFKLTYNPICIQ
ncbi:hypothetical protein BGZ99_005391 [Dissophora globulifera]|uniref:Uncharacterized protein n=1 Tax=Dissophora globulifera TaxID=979702 RepID=A0A9P6RF68_9FUNG|nr:hypothetical protein BGZ99_005391 [Dissophora globulifera]